ncbi:acyltransferase family protein [Novosphingobium sp. FSY-8]|uniref:Acyltransferase family protein n=1 Tax=Novosphingobium ovatum TaxID=1908523 RepID=A0ABW9XA49_9SPHN|nr:acyltransferase [Novosphingobium ovatum]NBC35387.1 acyltransferase family protein [Novosphingobium ovatum]
MAHPAPSPARLPLLDGLRGFAALAVLFHHEPGVYGSHGLLGRAYLAVDFFFMLSGFVLALAFDDRFRRGLDPDSFIVARLGRLWPVLALGVLIGGAAHLWAGEGSVVIWLTLFSLALVPVARGEWAIYQLNGPQWSLTFEVLANYAHATLLWRLSNRALLGLTLACGAVLAWCGLGWGSLGVGDVAANWWGGFARIGFGYGMGLWLARRWRAGTGRPPAWAAWSGAMILPVTLTTGAFWPGSWVEVDMACVFLLFPISLWCAAHVSLRGGIVGWASALGAVSYPVYALHVPLLWWGGKIARLHPEHQSAIRLGTLALIIALSVAVARSPLARGWRPGKSLALRPSAG